MSDGDSFVLKLIDKLTGPAKAMAKALESVTKAEAAVTAASGAASSAVAKTGAAVASAGAMAAKGAAGFDKAAKAMKAATSTANAARVAQGSTSWSNVKVGFGGAKYGARNLSGGIGGHLKGAGMFGPRYDPSAQGAAAGGMGPIFDRKAQGRDGLFTRIGDGIEDGVKGLSRWNSAAGESISKWKELSSVFMSTPFGMVLGGLGKIGGVLIDIVSSLASALFTAGKLVVAFGAIAAVSFAKKAVEMASFAESSKQALSFLTGGKASGDAAFNTGKSLAAQLGTDVEDTVHQLIKLRSMQFSIGEGSEIIKLGADLKAITGDAQSAERAIVAMTQIKAKGKLQSEELVGQLAEAGVSTVLVYEQLEKLLGKDRAGVMAQISAGKVDADTGLKAIKAAILHKVGTDEAGKVGAAFANKTFGGLYESLKNTFKTMFLDVGQQLDLGPLKEAMQMLKASLSFSDTGKMAKFVQSMIGGVSRLIPLVIEFASGFGTTLSGIADALSFGPGADLKKLAFEAGQGLGTFFIRVIEWAQKAIPVIWKAMDGFFEGLNVNKLLDDIGQFDWNAFGKSLAVIAEAIGKVISKTAEFLGGTATATANVIDSVQPESQRRDHVLGKMQSDWSWLNPFADAAPSIKAEPIVDPKAMQAKAPVTANVVVNLTPPSSATREDVQVMTFDIQKAMRKEITRTANELARTQ
jgi:tape measure domain-containing protein